MKRQLSARELILLGLLLVLVVVGGYVMLFYLPMNAELSPWCAPPGETPPAAGRSPPSGPGSPA